jgi:hypothetical protein
MDALRRARATSHASAVTLGALPVITAEHLAVFLAAGMIREGPPGTYYATTAGQPGGAALPTRPFTPMRVALMMAVWLVVIAVPFLVWLLA